MIDNRATGYPYTPGGREAEYPLRYAEFVRASHSMDSHQTPYWSFVMGDELNFYQVIVDASAAGPKVLAVYSTEDANG